MISVSKNQMFSLLFDHFLRNIVSVTGFCLDSVVRAPLDNVEPCSICQHEPSLGVIIAVPSVNCENFVYDQLSTPTQTVITLALFTCMLPP